MLNGKIEFVNGMRGGKKEIRRNNTHRNIGFIFFLFVAFFMKEV